MFKMILMKEYDDYQGMEIGTFDHYDEAIQDKRTYPEEMQVRIRIEKQ